MITVPAHRVKQFGVEFFQASFSAKDIDRLVKFEVLGYDRDCKDAGTLPAIPGAVIITSEKRFTFTPMASQHDLGLLQIPEEHGVLRVLDGQHRLLALHALTQAGENLGIEVPAVLFDRL